MDYIKIKDDLDFKLKQTQIMSNELEAANIKQHALLSKKDFKMKRIIERILMILKKRGVNEDRS